MIKSGSVMHLVLLALRPGPMSFGDLKERFSALHSDHMANLLRMKLVRQDEASDYHITDLGKRECPARRDIKPVITAMDYHFKTKEKKRVITAKPATSVEPAKRELNGEPKMSKVEKMLRLLATKRKAKSLELYQVSRSSSIKASLQLYINKGQIIKTGAGSEATYEVAEGFDTSVWFDGSIRRERGYSRIQKVGVATNHSECAAKPAAQQNSPQAQASGLSGGDQSDVEGTTITAESTAQLGQVDEDRIPAFLEHPTETNNASDESNGGELIAAIKQIFARLPKMTELKIGRTSQNALYVDVGMLNGDVSLLLDGNLDAVESVISAVCVIERFREN